MVNHIDLHGTQAPALADVLKPEAADRLSRRPQVERAAREAAESPLSRDVFDVLHRLVQHGPELARYLPVALARLRVMLEMGLVRRLSDGTYEPTEFARMRYHHDVAMHGHIERPNLPLPGLRPAPPGTTGGYDAWFRADMGGEPGDMGALREPSIAPLTGNLSEVLVPSPANPPVDTLSLIEPIPHSHCIADSGHSNSLPGETRSPVVLGHPPVPSGHVHAVNGGSHTHGITGLGYGHHVHLASDPQHSMAIDPRTVNAHSPFSRPEDVEPQAAHGGAVSGAQRVRLYPDGSIVIDTLANPLVARPLSQFQADPEVFELDSLSGSGLSGFIAALQRTGK
jgi:hypothetical protein